MKGSITLNRRLKTSWLIEALRLRAENSSPEEARARLEAMLSEDTGGKESVRKSLRYLRQVWLEPHPVYGKLQAEGIDVFRAQSTAECGRFLSFFMLLAIYPFAREVAEVCGQLFRLQGTIKSEQVKRKIVATHGQREPVVRSARYTVSLFLDLGVLQTNGTKGIYTPGNLAFGSASAVTFALDALLKSLQAERGIGRNELEYHSSLFALNSHDLIEKALNDPRFVVSRESVSKELISLRN